MNTVSLRGLSYSYENSDQEIFSQINANFSEGFSCLVGPNGCGKSTLLKLIAGILSPPGATILNSFSHISYCSQEIMITGNKFIEFCSNYDQNSIELKTSLNLHELLHNQDSIQEDDWKNMSLGEQKRLQLAIELAQGTDLLLLDEPTNHLDKPSKDYIIRTLKKFKGTCILVGHDRDLLNQLCSKCYFFYQGKLIEFSGNYTIGHEHFQHYLESTNHQRENLKKKIGQISKEAKRLESLNQNSKSRLSKRNLDKKDHDGKGKIDAAKLTSKDACFGQKKLNLLGRMEKLNQQLSGITVNKSHLGSISFELEGSHYNKLLLEIPETQLQLKNETSIHIPKLTLFSHSKVSITGPNGIGKTSFLQWILENNFLKTNNFFYLSQNYNEEDEKILRSNILKLDNSLYSKIFHIVARLGSSCQQIMSSNHWSAGERRKMALAYSITQGRELLILDEPTNHFDLSTIECLEETLAQENIALLIVSHDKYFLEKICKEKWVFIIDKSKNCQIIKE